MAMVGSLSVTNYTKILSDANLHACRCIPIQFRAARKNLKQMAVGLLRDGVLKGATDINILTYLTVDSFEY